MENILFDLSRILPEITLFLGTILVFLYGTYFGAKDIKRVAMLSVFLLGIVLYNIFICDFDDTVLSGMLYVNKFTTIAKTMIVASGAFIILMLIAISKHEKFLKFEVPILMLISILGMMLLVSSVNLLSLYISLEMMSLPLYVLAASNRDNALSTEAGMKYFILGALASGLFLFGASMIYGFTGVIDFESISHYYNTHFNDNDSITIPIGFLIGLVFVIVAFCFKISAVPFHMWTPDVYQGSPTIVTAFFASAVKVTSLCIFARILCYGFMDLVDQWNQIIFFISIASMLVGSLGAIMQKSLKRLLAYSSIGHVGFILMGLIAANPDGIRGMLLYMIVYIFMTLGVFSCILIFQNDKQYKGNIEDLTGLAKSNPFFAFVMAVLMFSMAGIPPLGGFFAKFYVLIPIIKKGLYPLAVIAVVTSVIAAFYYLRIVKVMYFDEQVKLANIQTLSLILAVIVILSTVFNLLFSLFPHHVLEISHIGATALFK